MGHRLSSRSRLWSSTDGVLCFCAAGNSSFAVSDEQTSFLEAFGSPTPNLDYSPLSSFSTSPEWGSMSLFGDQGQAAGFIDDSPPVRPSDSFDFGDYSDLPLFGPSSNLPKSTTTLPPDFPSFESIEASFAQFPSNETTTVAEPTAPAAPAAPGEQPQTIAPASYSDSPALAALDGFPAASPATTSSAPTPAAAPVPKRQTSSSFPSSSAAVTALPLRRSSAPTGHRKGLGTKDLLDLEAPIQPRTYATPSATSKKRTPAAFEGRLAKAASTNKKRKKSASTADDEDDISGSSTALTGTPLADGEVPPAIEDAIAAKRRQNTLAARRSRIRKLEHLKGLESLVDILGAERARLLAFAERALALHPDLAGLEGCPLDGGVMTAGEEEARRLMMTEAFGEEEE